MTSTSQLADKVCALFEKHGEAREHSSRARDLADIAMIAAQVDLDGDEVAERIRGEERRRVDAGTLDAPLPEALTLPTGQRQDWARRWDRATRGAPISFEEALASATALIDPILSRSARGTSWRAAHQRLSSSMQVPAPRPDFPTPRRTAPTSG